MYMIRQYVRHMIFLCTLPMSNFMSSLTPSFFPFFVSLFILFFSPVLFSRLGLRSNGEAGSLARRNKYLMGEAVRNAGIRAVLQQVLDGESDY